MAENNVETLITNLDSLNTVSNKAGLEFQGLTKRLIKMSDNVSGAGRKWTIFSRIVSGSPIWKIQNKIRAFIDSLAMMQEASEKNAKAQKEMDNKVMTLVKNYRFLNKQIEEGNNKGKTELEILKEKGEQLTIISEKLQKEKSPKYLEQAIKDIASLTDNQKGAIENTVAFNKAFMLGKSDAQAYAEGIDELAKKAKQVQGVFKEGRKNSLFAERLKTTKGRKTINQDISKQISNLPSFGSRVDKGIKKKIDQLAGFVVSIEGMLDEIKNTGVFKFIVSSIKKNESLQKLRIRVMLMLLTAFKIIKPIFSYLFKVLIIMVVVMALIVLAAKLAFDTYDLLNDIPQFMILVMAVIDAVLDNIMLIFNMIGALLSGDMYEFIEYALDFFDNLLIIGLGLLGLALGGLFALAVGVVYSSLDTVYKYFNGLFGGEHGEFSEAVNKILLRVLIFFAVLYFVKQVALVLLHVALTKGFYILLILGIGAAIIGGIKFLIKNFKLPFFADGGVSGGGMAVVGERGPELVNLPKGARVHSNRDSRKMSSSVINNNVSVTINAKDTSDAELRRIADQVGSMITNKLNRTTSSSGFIR